MATQEGHDEEARANARLIAAAPDLLAALNWYVEGKTSGPDETARMTGAARAAIAKAEGGR